MAYTSIKTLHSSNPNKYYDPYPKQYRNRPESNIYDLHNAILSKQLQLITHATSGTSKDTVLKTSKFPHSFGTLVPHVCWVETSRYQTNKLCGHPNFHQSYWYSFLNPHHPQKPTWTPPNCSKQFSLVFLTIESDPPNIPYPFGVNFSDLTDKEFLDICRLFTLTPHQKLIWDTRLKYLRETS